MKNKYMDVLKQVENCEKQQLWCFKTNKLHSRRQEGICKKQTSHCPPTILDKSLPVKNKFRGVFK